MGRAEIVSEKGAGLYEIRVRHETTVVDNRIAKLTADATSLGAYLTSLEPLVANAKSVRDTASQALSDGIIAGEEADTIQSLTLELIRAEKDYKQALVAYRRVELLIAAYTKQAETLTAAKPADDVVDAWIADYTLGLAAGTEVGTIEVGRQKGLGPNYIIEPANGSDLYSYDAERDGGIVPTISQTPEQAFYNYAMLPGVDRWLPRYRTGLVVATPAGAFLDVLLDDLEVGHQALNVNASDTLYAVPVEYMGLSTPAALFEIGDHVVVKFRSTSPTTPLGNWSDPVVIGFAHDPKAGLGINGPAHFYDGAVYTVRGLAPPLAWTLHPWVEVTVLDSGDDWEQVRISWLAPPESLFEIGDYEEFGEPDRYGGSTYDDWTTNLAAVLNEGTSLSGGHAGATPRYHGCAELEVFEVATPANSYTGRGYLLAREIPASYDHTGDPDTTWGTFGTIAAAVAYLDAAPVRWGSTVGVVYGIGPDSNLIVPSSQGLDEWDFIYGERWTGGLYPRDAVAVQIRPNGAQYDLAVWIHTNFDVNPIEWPD